MENVDNKDRGELSPLMNLAISFLRNTINEIKDGKCDEKELAEIMIRINPTNNGFVKEEDFMNYDEASAFLGITNRNRLSELCKKHKVANKRFKNHFVGFRKTELEIIKSIM